MFTIGMHGHNFRLLTLRGAVAFRHNVQIERDIVREGLRLEAEAAAWDALTDMRSPYTGQAW